MSLDDNIRKRFEHYKSRRIYVIGRAGGIMGNIWFYSYADAVDYLKGFCSAHSFSMERFDILSFCLCSDETKRSA